MSSKGKARGGVQLRIRDRGYNALLAKKWGVETITVGVHGTEGDQPKQDGDGPSDLTVAEVAAIHEFGLGVPERSWLRAFVDENEVELRKMLSATARQVAMGKLDERVAMSRFGLRVVGMIKKRIAAGIAPPLAEATKKQKARLTGGEKDTPLVLFAQFISSITFELERSVASSIRRATDE